MKAKKSECPHGMKNGLGCTMCISDAIREVVTPNTHCLICNRRSRAVLCRRCAYKYSRSGIRP